jgi:hypothetical protein
MTSSFAPEQRTPFYLRHRGPFRLVAVRQTPKGPAVQWLKGNVEGEEAEAEAKALMTDPRDTIDAVEVWSERQSQFVHTFA